MYKITQEQEILRDTIREFSRNEIAPLAASIDWETVVPESLYSNLPTLGLYGVTVPSEYGGVGADFLSAVIACEEISRASGSIGAQLSIHNAVVSEALRLSNNNALRETLLPKLAKGTLGAFCSDDRLSCKIEGNELVLDGSTDYVLNAQRAGVFVIAAKLYASKSDRVLVAFERKQQDGLRVGAPKKMLGLRASGTACISFEKMKIPISSLLFDVKDSVDALAKLTCRSRLAVASQALGLAEAALDAEIKYANERSQFNTKIGRFYAVQEFIASDEISIETSRSLTYLAASQIDSSPTISRDSAIAKVASSNCSVSVSRHAIRVHGGYGFIRDYPVERYLRDSRATQIYLESNESLKAVIASSLLGYS
jgi:alkylation response protein AidB-like acyl-CoA dehydrogenase